MVKFVVLLMHFAEVAEHALIKSHIKVVFVMVLFSPFCWSREGFAEQKPLQAPSTDRKCILFRAGSSSKGKVGKLHRKLCR